MAVHKILIEDFEEAYSLVAIHSPLDDYRLAFVINKALSIKLARSKTDISFEKHGSTFNRYQWYEQTQEFDWNLVCNSSTSEQEGESLNQQLLFNDLDASFTSHQLIPELPKVDFFLKIEGDQIEEIEKEVLQKLQNSPQIIMAYSVEVNKIKSKNNIIFE
jgi:hypothetical protein